MKPDLALRAVAEKEVEEEARDEVAVEVDGASSRREETLFLL
jgi:hypothetical protein